MNTEFLTISFSQEPVPCLPSFWAHVLCGSKQEQEAILDFFKRYYPSLSLIVRALNSDSVREDAPFIHSVRNKNSVKSDRFFQVTKFINGAHCPEPIFEKMDAADFLMAYSAATGHPRIQVTDVYLTPQEAASAFGKIGGSSKSKAKSSAARANGKKGGRPRKAAAI